MITLLMLVQILPKLLIKSDRNFMDYITKATSKLNFQAVSESTVQRLLLSLNPRKSTGIDKIPAKIIRDFINRFILCQTTFHFHELDDK